MQRREFLRTTATVGLAASALPGVAFAGAATRKRFILVILRGAVDGLAVAAPLDDPDYAVARGELALAPDEVLPLEGPFGLHPSLAWLHTQYADGQALVAHAAATPYRERSHFDGQDVLENGGNGGVLRDGWLARAAMSLDTSRDGNRAIALSETLPLVLRGDTVYSSWSPSRLPGSDDDTLARLADLYTDDAFFATRLQQALAARDLVGAEGGRRDAGRRWQTQERDLMTAAARFLAAEDGPRIAVIESGGWDTHANQGAATGALANRLAALDAGLAALQGGLGEHWSDTVVAVVTEFGRTVRVNGTRGTDHGTGTVALLAGGAVAGGRVIADWPGLARHDLFEGRDLRPTTDVRVLMKGVLHDHMRVTRAALDTEVFPDSAAAAPARDLIRA